MEAIYYCDIYFSFSVSPKKLLWYCFSVRQYCDHSHCFTRPQVIRIAAIKSQIHSIPLFPICWHRFLTTLKALLRSVPVHVCLHTLLQWTCNHFLSHTVGTLIPLKLCQWGVCQHILLWWTCNHFLPHTVGTLLPILCGFPLVYTWNKMCPKNSNIAPSVVIYILRVCKHSEILTPGHPVLGKFCIREHSQFDT